MKLLTLLLALALLGNAPACAQWTLQPFTFSNTFAPYPPNAATINIVDAQTVWATSINQYSGFYFGSNEVARTTDGGSTWTVGTVDGIDFYNEIITDVKGLSNSTALICTSSPVSRGRILKTVDGGVTWTTQTTAGQLASPDSYADFFAFFSATEGICIGDPIVLLNNHFELYRTLDAGTTWTAVNTAAMPVSLLGEFATSTSGACLNDNVWFTTNAGRVFRSPDKGVTWTVSNTALTSYGNIAFRDALNGLFFAPYGGGLVRTTDGSITWQPVAYAGPAHERIRHVPGTRQYLSAGQGADAGSSYSHDNGATWTALETTRSHFDLAVLSSTVAWSAALKHTATLRTGLGVYRLTNPVLGTAAPTVLPANQLSVVPNPSADGQFVVTLAAGVQAEGYTVLDALGRLVLVRTLTPAATCQLDLGPQAPGLYTLQLRTSHGMSQQKLMRR